MPQGAGHVPGPGGCPADDVDPAEAAVRGGRSRPAEERHAERHVQEGLQAAGGLQAAADPEHPQRAAEHAPVPDAGGQGPDQGGAAGHVQAIHVEGAGHPAGAAEARHAAGGGAGPL